MRSKNRVQAKGRVHLNRVHLNLNRVHLNRVQAKGAKGIVQAKALTEFGLQG